LRNNRSCASGTARGGLSIARRTHTLAGEGTMGALRRGLWECALVGTMGLSVIACGGGSGGKASGTASSSTTGTGNSGALGPVGSSGSSVNGAAGAPGTGAGPVGTTSSAAALPTAEIALTGGLSSAPGGVGQAGGNLHVISNGGITFDSTVPGPAVPMVPAVPASAIALGASDLAGDVSASGTAVIKGNVQSAGSDSIRHIAASGDVYIVGTLRGADLAGARQGFDIEAPG